MKNFYIINIFIFITTLSTICFTFFIQFKVDDLSYKMLVIDKNIINYQENIKALDIEWTYLTRLERLEYLAKVFKEETSNISYEQVKSFEVLSEFYLANWKKYLNENKIVMNNL